MLVSLVSSHLFLCFHVVTFCKPLVVEYEIAEMMAGNETAVYFSWCPLVGFHTCLNHNIHMNVLRAEVCSLA